MPSKKTTKKTISKKVAKKVARKKVTKKKAAKKATSKKVAKKSASKKVTKKSVKKVATEKVTKTVTKKKAAKKASTKKVSKKAASKKVTKKKSAKKATSKKASKKKSSKVKAKVGEAVLTEATAVKRVIKFGQPAAKATNVSEVLPASLSGVSPILNDEIATEPLTIDELRKKKPGLSKADLKHYEIVLRRKRGEIMGDVQSLNDDARGKGGNLSNIPLHMADVGSDNYEQEFTLGLMETESRMLWRINEAIGRINEGYYGVCVETGNPIGKARLDAKPWAKWCIEIAREKDKKGLLD